MTVSSHPDPLTVTQGERGLVRVFALDMAPEEARFLAEPGAVDQVLGVTGLDPDHVDVIAVRDLDDLGLAGYLAEGAGIPADQIDAGALDAVTGHVLILRSRAFGGHAATLTPSPKLHLIGLYSETPTDWTARPEPARDLSRRTPPREARSQARWLGFSFFVVVVALMLLIVIWVVK